MSDMPPDDDIGLDSGFPYNVVTELETAFRANEELALAAVVGRALRPTDPSRTLGIVANTWSQVQPPLIGQYDPSITAYDYELQLLVKHAKEDEGRRVAAQLSKTLRVMLYRDPDLRVGLASLSESSMQMTERVTKWSVRRQSFLANEINGQFIFLTTSEIVVEVDTV